MSVIASPPHNPRSCGSIPRNIDGIAQQLNPSKLFSLHFEPQIIVIGRESSHDQDTGLWLAQTKRDPEGFFLGRNDLQTIKTDSDDALGKHNLIPRSCVMCHHQFSPKELYKGESKVNKQTIV